MQVMSSNSQRNRWTFLGTSIGVLAIISWFAFSPVAFAPPKPLPTPTPAPTPTPTPVPCPTLACAGFDTTTVVGNGTPYPIGLTLAELNTWLGYTSMKFSGTLTYSTTVTDTFSN